MDERRSEQRLPNKKSGKIIFNSRQSVMDCRLRDISSKGARLKFVNTLGTPDEFQLELPGVATSRWVRCAWTKYDEMGVEFF